MRYLSLISILFFLTSCGYKPTLKMSQYILGEKVYAQVKISITDQQNSVLLQDAVNEAVVNRLGASLVEKQSAQTIINIKLQSVTFRPIIYDRNGYIISYKAKVVLDITTIFNNDTKRFYKAFGDYDFPIEANSVISDTNRFDAIKNSSIEALDEYIANISIQGYKYVNDNK